MRHLISGIILIFLSLTLVYAGETTNPETGYLDVTIDIQEEDGDPIVYAPTTLKVPNNSLGDNFDGSCSVDFTSIYLKLDGSNANQAIDISPYDFTSGDITISNATPYVRWTDTTTGHDDWEAYAENSIWYLTNITGLINVLWFNSVYDAYFGHLTNVYISQNLSVGGTTALILEDGNGAASTVDGKIKYDRTTETLEVGDGTNTRAIYTDGGIVFTIDGGGSAISTGAKTWLPMLKTGTLTGWDLTVDTSATITIDVWDDTYANFPPTNTDTMTNGNEPAITASTKATDTDITDWSDVVVTKGEYMRINVDANDNATIAVLWLKARWE